MKRLTTILSILLSVGLLMVAESAFGQWSSAGSGGYYTNSVITIGAYPSTTDQALRVVGTGSEHGLVASADAYGRYAIKALGTGYQEHGIFADVLYGYAIRAKAQHGWAGYFEGTVRVNGSTTLDNLTMDVLTATNATLSSNDPDLNLNMHSSSSSSLLQLRFQVSGNTQAEFRYNRSSDEFQLIHGSDVVMTTNHNSSNDYWTTFRRGIRAWKLKTDATLADYVFQPGHRLTPLSEVEQFVWQHHHLPGVVSQAEVDEAGGVELTAFTVQLQEKLEELYLHTIALEKRVQALEAELSRTQDQQ